MRYCVLFLLLVFAAVCIQIQDTTTTTTTQAASLTIIPRDNATAPCTSINHSACSSDLDCVCGGVDVMSGECFMGNREYYSACVNQNKTCPDYCNGIAGTFTVKCVDGECKLTQTQSTVLITPQEILYNISDCDESKSGIGFVSITADEKNIIIRQRLNYVCCANITLRSERSGNVIRVFESNVGGVCKCVCGYDINALILNLAAGEYKILVYGVDYNGMGVDRLGDDVVDVLGGETTTLASGKKSCASHEDCVKSSCCHASGCVSEKHAPDCSGVSCTLECKAGTMDCCPECGCLCVNGTCSWVNATLFQ